MLNIVSKKLYLFKIMLLFAIASAFVSCDSKSDKNQNNTQSPAVVVNDPNNLNNAGPLDISTGNLDQHPSYINQPNVAPRLFPERNLDSQTAIIESEEDMLTYRWQLLESATQSVRIQVLILYGDETGWMLGDKLIELHNRGVKVELIIDPSSNWGLYDHVLYYHLNSNGVIVHGYEAEHLKFFGDIIKGKNAGTVLDQHGTRMHEKMFIVDAEIPQKAVAIVGGTNYENGYYRVSNEARFKYRDQDIAMKGALVQDALTVFNENIITVKNKAKEYKVFDAGSIWSTIDKIRQSFGIDLSIKAPRPDFNQEILANIQTVLQRQPVLHWESAPSRFFISQPKQRPSEIYGWYATQIMNAKHSIKISNSYLIPDAPLRQLLNDAAKRNVKVEILTNSPQSSDLSQAQYGARSLYPLLLESAPVQSFFLYEWSGYKLKDVDESLHHAKYAVFDNEIAIVGSYNLDPRSQLLNSESALVTTGRHTIDFLTQRFNREILPNLSERITYEMSKTLEQDYTFVEKFKSLFGKLFLPIL